MPKISPMSLPLQDIAFYVFIILFLLSLSESAGLGRLLPPALVLFWFSARRWRRGRRGARAAGAERTRQCWGAGRPGPCGRAAGPRWRSRPFCCCLRTARCSLDRAALLSPFSYGLQTAFLRARAALRSLAPSSSRWPLLPSPLPSSSVTLGARRVTAFSLARWLPSTGLCPLDSLPPCRHRAGIRSGTPRVSPHFRVLICLGRAKCC